MSDKDITIQQLEEQKRELNEQLEQYEFQGPSVMIQKIEDELYEVNDSIKKLS